MSHSCGCDLCAAADRRKIDPPPLSSIPYFTYEYHWADYHAKANWNLRNDLAHPKSFEHNADATGSVIATGFNIALHEHAALNINFDYQSWSTDNGTHKVFFSNGKTAKTRLNEVNWSTYALSLGLTLRF